MLASLPVNALLFNVAVPELFNTLPFSASNPKKPLPVCVPNALIPTLLIVIAFPAPVVIPSLPSLFTL